MTGLLKRGALTILGVAVTLGFWTVRDWVTDSASASLSHIPEKVWNGGGGEVVVEVETSSKARVSASFETNGSDQEYLETWERVGPGIHNYTIDVPANVGGMVEVSSEDPKVGDKVRIAVKVGGNIVGEDEATLDEPLKPGYGFFAQVTLDDYATGKLGED